ncbi:MAG: hypothetical protein HYS33_00110 [Acidobacteria bacterium]|nr:hypothetical protein [Acidobacteriota bacterium]MBI1984427.1 hypothetical protein [Acidobacteriota bacterium]
MGTIRRLSLAAGIVAMLFAASVARAEEYRGTFTLPIEVRWGNATLPPGDYTFVLEADKFPQLATIRGEKTAAMVMPTRGAGPATSGKSALILIRAGNQGFVRQLRLVEAGLAFNYGPPLPKGRLLAQGPELIQRIPVRVSSGK